jgi:Sap-like sulfolipid-1-addressing protein
VPIIAVILVHVVLDQARGRSPPVAYLIGGERVTHVLDGWRAWLSEHNTAVMAVLFLVYGAVLFSQGLRGLT